MFIFLFDIDKSEDTVLIISTFFFKVLFAKEFLKLCENEPLKHLC